MKWLLLCLLSLSLSIKAEAIAKAESVDEFAKYEVYLLTVDIGPTLDSRYGHTILRILDSKTGEDHLYNWGTFSFSNAFYINFVQGKLRYWVSDQTYDDVLYQYGYYLKRNLISDRLVLTNKQKSELISIIHENMQGSNIFFWYDFFFNNCSTIPRDYLDRILHGELFSRFTQRPASKNFRQYVRDHLNYPPIIGLILEINLTSPVDQDISQWQEMFYPPKLRDYLAELPAFDDEGKAIPQSSFFTDSKTLVAGESYPSPTTNLFPYVGLCGGLMLLLCAYLSFFVQKSRKSFKLRLPFALFSMVWGLSAWILSILMIFGWVFSEHKLLYHNVNLLVFWPLDIVWFGFGLSFLFQRKKRAKPSLFTKFLVYYGALHLLGLAVFLGLYVISYWQQNVYYMLVYILPVAGLYSALSIREAYLSLKKSTI